LLASMPFLLRVQCIFSPQFWDFIWAKCHLNLNFHVSFNIFRLELHCSLVKLYPSPIVLQTLNFYYLHLLTLLSHRCSSWFLTICRLIDDVPIKTSMYKGFSYNFPIMFPYFPKFPVVSPRFGGSPLRPGPARCCRWRPWPP
jgi:hypothetical protein